MSKLKQLESRIKSARSNMLPSITLSTKDGIALIKEMKSHTSTVSKEPELLERIALLEAVLEVKNAEIEELSKPITVSIEGQKF